MTKPNPYLWPIKSNITFYNGWGRCLFKTKNRRLNLSDTIILRCHNVSRTIHMGISTETLRWQSWGEDEIRYIENLIRYDLGFDAYHVSIKRMSKIDISCSEEFRLKLLIRTKY